jgi:pimeloyl-ACP methyl ester carboxylesterase
VTALRLHTTSWGRGRRVAVLVHGMMADSGTWWQVGPALADRGYLAIAVDLPGHGRSPRCPSATMADWVTALTDVVPMRPDLVIAHSMGGFVTAAALPRLDPARVVYVDTPLGPSRTDVDVDAMTAVYRSMRDRRTVERLRRKEPGWHERDLVAEADAAVRFDAATWVGLLGDVAGVDHSPRADVPSLMIRPDPSRFLPDTAVDALLDGGFAVRSLPGASHIAWYGHHEAFMSIIDGWAGGDGRPAAPAAASAALAASR